MERLPGFREFFPEPLPPSEVWSAEVRQRIFSAWREVAGRYGFREYDGPPLEPLELYTQKSGDEIVRQLYNFSDKGDRQVALRPEMTPTLARMAAARERGYRKPMKWYAIPQLFRYEKQQRGRLREHFQFNADILGELDRGADGELVALLVDSLRVLGLTSEDFVVRLSSREAWRGFYREYGRDGAREYDFFQVIDKLERDKPEVSEAALLDLGIEIARVREFISEAKPTDELRVMRDDLEARGLGDYVRVDYGVVRGLAYYTGPVYEAFDRKGKFRAIAGGGRYDQLVKLVSKGKVDMPALGFGMGDVVLTELLRERGKLPDVSGGLDIFCLVEDESMRRESLRVVQRLRDQGRAVDYALAPVKSDKQFKRALELGAAYTLRLERDGEGRMAVKLKNLSSREEACLGVEELLGRFA